MSDEKPSVEGTDILEQVKKAEQAIKRRALMKRISQIKELCKDVLVAKKKCELIMEDSGVSQEDAKRLLDYLNSMPEVQLSEDEVKDLKDDIKDQGITVKKEVQKEMDKVPAANMMYAALSSNGATGGTNTSATGSWSGPATSITYAGGNSGTYALNSLVNDIDIK